MNIQMQHLINAWNKRCLKVFCLSSEDLPDILLMDDFFFEGMTQADVADALDEMEQLMREELNFDY